MAVCPDSDHHLLTEVHIAMFDYSKIIFFKGLNDTEINECLTELQAREKKYEKGEVVLLAGTQTSRMGIVLSGSVTIENNDTWGNCTILSHVGKYGFFAETYAFLGDEVMLVDVRANEDCRILFLNLTPLRKMPASPKAWEYKLTRNLLTISSHKNLTLTGRSFHISPHTIRGRILSYLNTISLRLHAKEFDIPFNRQQLADYLNVERTALSKELGKMKQEGLIDFHKNHFILKD